MAVHMSSPPKGLELTRMLPSQFYTFWASLNTDFAASESALEHFMVRPPCLFCLYRVSRLGIDACQT